MSKPMNNPKTISPIERQVMASVGAVYFARTLTGTTALKVYAFILSMWVVGRLVWVSKVFANFVMVEKGGLSAMSNFVLYAVEHAHLGVQLALLVAAVAFVSLVVEAARKLSEPAHFYSF
jgi:aspartate/tyrosine/aromatic aminotransferase